MIAAVCTAIAVIVAGAALRPRPPQRRLEAERSARRSPTWRPLPRTRRIPTITPFDVATWCEALSRALRSGATLTAAIRSTAPPPSLDADIDRIVLSLDRGATVADAAASATASPHLRVALIVIRATAINGGSAAEPLDRAAATLRARAADTADRQVQSAQARLSAIVMTALPLAMLALLLVTSSATRAAVLTAPGLAAVALGGALNVSGWRWMRRLTAGGVA